MNMIEKVARSIAQVSIADATGNMALSELAPIVEERWSEYLPEALAAITALREPTPDMLIGSWALTGIEEGQWQAMIDRAMSPDIDF